MSLYIYSASVVKVVDGDTVDLEVDLGFGVYKIDRFRLLGINAPELHSTKPGERERGEAARQFLASLCEGKDVEIETFKDKADKYGRYLVMMDAGDVQINAAMVAAGHAVEYFGGRRE